MLLVWWGARRSAIVARDDGCGLWRYLWRTVIFQTAFPQSVTERPLLRSGPGQGHRCTAASSSRRAERGGNGGEAQGGGEPQNPAGKTGSCEGRSRPRCIQGVSPTHRALLVPCMTPQNWEQIAGPLGTDPRVPEHAQRVPELGMAQSRCFAVCPLFYKCL